MKFKMRIIYHSRSGVAEPLALAIARDQKATSDKIPPAYPIENEKLLIMLVEMKGSSVDKAVTDFCKDLNPNRTKNVAILAVGGTGTNGIDEMKKVITANGINVVGNTHQCPLTGLFKKSVPIDAVQASVDWAAKIVESL